MVFFGQKNSVFGEKISVFGNGLSVKGVPPFFVNFFPLTFRENLVRDGPGGGGNPQKGNFPRLGLLNPSLRNQGHLYSSTTFHSTSGISEPQRSKRSSWEKNHHSEYHHFVHFLVWSELCHAIHSRIHENTAQINHFQKIGFSVSSSSHGSEETGKD